MKKSGQYKTAHLIEDQYEPGSNGQVLKNKLGIASASEMDRLEKEEQLRTMSEKEEYIKAIHAGVERNYKPMGKVFTSVIRKTLKAREPR